MTCGCCCYTTKQNQAAKKSRHKAWRPDPCALATPLGIPYTGLRVCPQCTVCDVHLAPQSLGTEWVQQHHLRKKKKHRCMGPGHGQPHNSARDTLSKMNALQDALPCWNSLAAATYTNNNSRPRWCMGVCVLPIATQTNRSTRTMHNAHIWQCSHAQHPQQHGNYTQKRHYILRMHARSATVKTLTHNRHTKRWIHKHTQNKHSTRHPHNADTAYVFTHHNTPSVQQVNDHHTCLFCL